MDFASGPPITNEMLAGKVDIGSMGDYPALVGGAKTQKFDDARSRSVWRRHRTTILFVTHDVDEALALADRIAVLTPRPARVQHLVQVPTPRVGDAIHDPRLAALRDELIGALDGTRASPDTGVTAAEGSTR